jgi:hypothetical protein
VVASFEPGEEWFFDYEKQRMIKVRNCFRLTRTRKLNRSLALREGFQRTGSPVCIDRVPQHWKQVHMDCHRFVISASREPEYATRSK